MSPPAEGPLTVSSCSNSRCSVCYVDDVDAVVVFAVVVVLGVHVVEPSASCAKLRYTLRACKTTAVQKHQNLSLSNCCTSHDSQKINLLFPPNTATTHHHLHMYMSSMFTVPSTFTMCKWFRLITYSEYVQTSI